MVGWLVGCAHKHAYTHAKHTPRRVSLPPGRYAQLVLRVLPKLIAHHFNDQFEHEAKLNGAGAGAPTGNADAGVGGGGAGAEGRLSLTESFGGIYHNMMVHQWLMGVVSHEVAWHTDALPFLQKECGFDQGELTVFITYARHCPSLACMRG